MIFVSINKGWIGYLPPLDELQNPKNKYATELYSSDMKVLGRYYISENRVGVSYNEISENVIEALVATEDARYYDHSGVDAKALGRAIILTGIMGKKSAGGGSTITQQLAKQLYSPRTDGFIERMLQKPIEWVIAVKLEKLYSKEEIIAMYLNQFDFLYNAVGIKSAAQVYFNTTPDKLTVEQAATLIGMCKNPSLYNPVRYNERSMGRRNVVLNQMVKADYLTEHEYDSLKLLPLDLDFRRLDHNVGIARYFREYLRGVLTAKNPRELSYASWQKQKYEDDLWEWENNPLYGFCNKNRKADGSPYNIYTDGLKIYTTIDSRMQQYAEEAVLEHMKEIQKDFTKEKKGLRNAPFSRDLTDAEVNTIMRRAVQQSDYYWKLKHQKKSEQEIEKIFNTPREMTVFSYNGSIDTVMTPLDSIRYHKFFLRCGMMSVDSRNGHVKAYVGGTDYNWFKYDMATMGRRQVGSTIKPFLYTLAMEEGMSPCDEVINDSITLINEYGKPWTPRNDSKARVGERVTLRWGLANSNNWTSAYLMSLFAPQSFVNLLRSFGVRGEIDPVYSLALGTCDISVKEMVGAYTSFPNKGIRTEPLYVTRIDDVNGNNIMTFTPQMQEVYSEATSYKMISMLQNVIDYGTGRRVRRIYGLRMPMGGKTGTTQNHSDGWFMGFTPKLVSGVWVGGEDRSIRFDRITEGQGASMSLPIWAIYMKKVLNDPELEYTFSDEFDMPSDYNPNAGCRSDDL
nr:transglycosylase domain-containing protein [Paludibacter sp. 221]